MKNTIFTLAVIAIAIVGGANAFASVHHNQNGNTAELTGDAARIHRLTKAVSQNVKSEIQQAHFQKNSVKFAVSAIYKTDVETTLWRNHTKLTSKHHFLEAGIYQVNSEHHQNLQNISLTHLENRWNGAWHNFHADNSHENIGDTSIGYG